MKSWLAAQADVRKEQVSRWFAGKTVPHPSTQAKIEQITGGAVRAAQWPKRSAQNDTRQP